MLHEVLCRAGITRENDASFGVVDTKAERGSERTVIHEKSRDLHPVFVEYEALAEIMGTYDSTFSRDSLIQVTTNPNIDLMSLLEM